MAQVIVYTNENGNVSVTYPTGELPIEQVLAKDCPENAIIVDDSELPTDDEFFNAWELINGKIVVNLDKKNAMLLEKEAATLTKQSALAKLSALGLTQDEISTLVG
jgi:hypothetical protein